MEVRESTVGHSKELFGALTVGRYSWRSIVLDKVGSDNLVYCGQIPLVHDLFKETEFNLT
jgi:hypothetical protein